MNKKWWVLIIAIVAILIAMLIIIIFGGQCADCGPVFQLNSPNTSQIIRNITGV